MQQQASFQFSNGSIAPEIALLLGCARTHVDDDTKGRIRSLLNQKLDWDNLVGMAMGHGVTPLLYRTLQSHFKDVTPPTVLRGLERFYQGNALHNRFLTAELMRIVDLFKAHGIKTIPYKGPALAVTAYRDLALRQFGDLDILLPKTEMLRAKELLLTLGYRPEYQMDAAEEKVFIDSHHDYPLMRENGRAVVEIQWAITQWSFRLPINFEYLAQRSEPNSRLGIDLLDIRPETLLLVLSVHASLHCWERLMWVCDVAELLRTHPGLDWQYVIEEGSRLGIKRMVLIGLLLSRDCLGVDLPDEAMNEIEGDAAAKALAGEARIALFSDDDRKQGTEKELAFHLRMRERLRDRVRFIAHHHRFYTRLYWSQILLPTDKDRNVLALPDWLSFLYYLVRPIRLLWVHGASGGIREVMKVLGQRV